MAKYNGFNGSMVINSNNIDEIEEWSIDETAQMVTGVAKGDATVIGEAGPVTRKLSFTCFLDPSDTAGQGSVTIGATVALMALYISGAGSGDYYYTCATGVVESITRNSPNDLSKMTVGVHLNAALVETVVA